MDFYVWGAVLILAALLGIFMLFPILVAILLLIELFAELFSKPTHR